MSPFLPTLRTSSRRITFTGVTPPRSALRRRSRHRADRLRRRPTRTAEDRTRAAAPAVEAAALAALVALDVRGRPAQARADLVGDDLDLRVLLAVALPALLLEAARHDHAGPLVQRLGDVLTELRPALDVE